jgi:hypothetical protein
MVNELKEFKLIFNFIEMVNHLYVELIVEID